MPLFLRAFMEGYLGVGMDTEALEADFEHLATTALANGVTRVHAPRPAVAQHHGPETAAAISSTTREGAWAPSSTTWPRCSSTHMSASPTGSNTGWSTPAPGNSVAAGIVDPVGFRHGFDYCAVCRNLQILGAFGFLSREKKKPRFADYIPAAVETLKRQLSRTWRTRDSPA